MIISHSINDFKGDLPYVVVTLGNFDGVHRGHQKLFNNAISMAKTHHGTSIILTFDPHPLKLLHPEIVIPQITPMDVKLQLLSNSGMDRVILQPFTHDFAKINAEDFIENILVKCLNPEIVIVGQNFRFGKDKKGDISFLKKLGKKLGYMVLEVEHVMDNDIVVSSSVIRSDIQNGSMVRAEKFLGRPYMIAGSVVQGDNRGREIGFPTANIETTHELIPPNGVYAVLVKIRNEFKNAVANIGVRPTFNKSERTIEVHLLDYDNSLYHHDLSIYFIKKLRDEVRFESVEALINKIKNDIFRAKKIFNDRS